MEVLEAVRERRSVRAYRDEPVPEEILEDIVEAARLAPSANNRQAWKFVLVRDAGLRASLVEAASGQRFVGEAPVVIAGVALEPERVMGCEVPPYAVDLAIALDHMTLVAAGKGLGTCWIGAFSQSKVKEILGIPDPYKVVALLPLGYPADSPRPRRRKDVSEIVCYDTFS